MLFPQGHDITSEGLFFAGKAKAGPDLVSIIGTREKADIGIDLAMRMKRLKEVGCTTSVEVLPGGDLSSVRETGCHRSPAAR